MTFLASPRDRAGVLIVALGAAICIALWPFLSGLLGAGALYVLFVSPHRWLSRRLPAGWSAALTLVGALVVVAVPLAAMIGPVIDQAPGALRSIEELAAFARAHELRVGPIDVGAEVAKASGAAVSWLSTRLLAFVGNATAAALNLVIAFFGLYYLLRSGDTVWPSLRELIPFSEETSEALRERFLRVTEAMMVGTVVVAAVQGTLIGVGFAVVGLPAPVFWGIATAFVSILPVLGSALVWLPAVIVLAFQARYGAAVTLLLIGGLVASNLDNIIRPFVYRRVSDLHPMITLVGAFAGVKYFGLVGLLLGPLAIAYLFELVRFYRIEYGGMAGETPARAPSARALQPF